MTKATWITMALILGFVWGGLGVALWIAARGESNKAGDQSA